MKTQEYMQFHEVRPKLVRIISRLNVGGPARQACMLHQKQSATMDSRLVVGALDAGEEDMSYLLTSEQNVFRLQRMKRKVSPWKDLQALLEIVRIIRKERPNLVHTHTAKAGALGRLAAWLCGVPVIVHTYHGNVFAGYFNRVESGVYVAVERLLGRLSTRVIAISETQRKELCTRYRIVPHAKTVVINNGFNLDCVSQVARESARERFGFKHDDIVVVWVGRMVPVKNIPLLGDVVRRAFERSSQVRFLIAGDGEQRQDLERQVAGCTNVKLIGWQQNMAAIWSAADIALLTSRNEGTPTVLMEAMAAGVPFVATNVGGVRDLAVDPVVSLADGIGFRAGNCVLTEQTSEALLGGIELVAGDRDAAKNMAAVGRKFVLERFSADRFVAEIDSLYKTLLNISQGMAGTLPQGEMESSERHA